METVKSFTFMLPNNSFELIVKVNEVVDADFGYYVWPCAPVLAQYLVYHKETVAKKRISELGAGTALAGIVAAKLGAYVTLSDAIHLPKCLENCRKNLALNNLSNSVRITGITWGELDSNLKDLQPFDIILGSDCFYDKKDFEDIIVTVAFLMTKNPLAQFWCTYQERSDRCIDSLLLKWGLEGYEVPLETFNADSDSIAGSNLPGCHTIRMFIIRKVCAE